MPLITKIRTSKLFWAAVLLLAGTAAWPLLSQTGLLNTRGGGDSPFLLQRLHQLTTALQDGHFPVRWMPDANYGYGYPFYNYYAPLSIYIAAVFRFLGFSFVGAIKAAQLAGFLAAGAGAYLLSGHWFKSRWAGLVAAVAYTFAPFHMVNVYVRGDSLAEFWAMAFYPLLLLTADDLVREPKRPLRIGLFALTYAALILSHNISALIFTPFLGLYLALRFFQKAKGQTKGDGDGQERPSPVPVFQIVLFISLAMLLALALAAWFWLPALSEQEFAQLEPVTAGYFHYSNHFRGANLIQPSFLFDYDVAGGGAFRMGLVQLGVVLAGIVVLWVIGVRRGKVAVLPALLITVSFLIATLMITPLSRPLWDNLPLLPFTQFPWRFLSIQALFGAMAAGGVALLPGRKVVVPLVVLGIAVSGLGDLKTDHLYLSDGDVTAERLAEYEWFTGNIGSTVSAEYLPPEVAPRPFTSPWLNLEQPTAVVGLDSVVESQAMVQETARKSWLVATNEPGAAVMLPVMAWPGWEATVDGSAVPSQPAAGSGLISVVVPNGEHTVGLQLRRIPVRVAAETVSLVAVLVIGGLFWTEVRRRNERGYLRWVAVGLGSLVILSVGLRLWPALDESPNTLSWDFEQLGYLHEAPEGIAFEDDLLLRQYSYSGEMVEAGEELMIGLTWENGGGLTADLALMTPAVQRVDDGPVLLSQSQMIEAGEVFYRFVIPENAPAGLYVPRLTVAGINPLTDSGQTRGDLFLRPIRVVGGGIMADGSGRSLEVEGVNVLYQSQEVLLVQLRWLTMGALTENYNVSLRLVDGEGRLVAQQDGQPGFGFLPSSGWRPGFWQDDWLTLRLPQGFEGADSGPYALVARLYDVETEAAVLTRRVGQLVWQEGELAFREGVPVFDLPEGISGTEISFEEVIELAGYELVEEAERLDLRLFWRALVDGGEDFFHFVHLVDGQTGEIVAQHDSMPVNNSYPTGQWVRGEIVEDRVQIDLAAVESGEYLLYLGLYRNLDDSFPALTGVDGAGRLLEGNRLLVGRVVVGN